MCKEVVVSLLVSETNKLISNKLQILDTCLGKVDTVCLQHGSQTLRWVNQPRKKSSISGTWNITITSRIQAIVQTANQQLTCNSVFFFLLVTVCTISRLYQSNFLSTSYVTSIPFNFFFFKSRSIFLRVCLGNLLIISSGKAVDEVDSP